MRNLISLIFSVCILAQPVHANECNLTLSDLNDIFRGNELSFATECEDRIIAIERRSYLDSIRPQDDLEIMQSDLSLIYGDLSLDRLFRLYRTFPSRSSNYSNLSHFGQIHDSIGIRGEFLRSNFIGSDRKEIFSIFVDLINIIGYSWIDDESYVVDGVIIRNLRGLGFNDDFEDPYATIECFFIVDVPELSLEEIQASEAMQSCYRERAR